MTVGSHARSDGEPSCSSEIVPDTYMLRVAKYQEL